MNAEDDQIDEPEIVNELSAINSQMQTLKVVTERARSVSPVATRRWKIPKPVTAIMIAISSRALFDMKDERKIYREKGLSAYINHMIDVENTPLKPGSAFPFVQALTNINLKLLELNKDETELFDVVLMSNNSAQVGVALINSINHHRIAAATVFDSSGIGQTNNKQLRIAFDGDAVLFSDEAEIIAKKHGLDKFFEHEAQKADQPLEKGPLKKFAMVLGKMKKKFHDAGIVEECPIRTYLVTARSAASSGLRALRTLRSWGLDIDEALFLAGAPKGPILERIRPHLFFDDQEKNVESGLEHGVESAHVPYGIAQQYRKK
ncbi:cytosolic 5'-nucleotidase 1A-like isoform X2 [Clavelina lepadiformis]|uniref:cytosolic 5'-nucleotidase 1A-like isoform X2 n=1 Tax=Clavelina lepadiformis TaxID=159417 RepID=UPI0040437760